MFAKIGVYAINHFIGLVFVLCINIACFEICFKLNAFIYNKTEDGELHSLQFIVTRKKATQHDVNRLRRESILTT